MKLREKIRTAIRVRAGFRVGTPGYRLGTVGYRPGTAGYRVGTAWVPWVPPGYRLGTAGYFARGFCALATLLEVFALWQLRHVQASRRA